MVHPKTLKAIILTLIICGLLFLFNLIWEIPDFKNKAWIFAVGAIIIANVGAHFWHEKTKKKEE
ncbi:MAG: hypothetical protein ACHQNT_09105 [Bacteroidia bacterium]